MKWLTEHGFARDKYYWERAEVRVWREPASRLWIAQDPGSGLWGQGSTPRASVVALVASLRGRARALDATADAVEGVAG